MPRHFASLCSALQGKVDNFRRDIERQLPEGRWKAVFAMAWLTTDNVLVALSRSHSPSVLSGVRLVAIDALHFR